MCYVVAFICSLLPKGLHSELILSSLQLVLCLLAAIKRLSAYNHSADYIFSDPFGIIRLILSQFENTVPLKPVLGARGQCYTITLVHMNRVNKTESAIFVSLMCSLFPKDLHSELI